MFCPHCGKSIPDGAAFCTECGSQIAQNAQQAQVRQETPYQQTAPNGSTQTVNVNVNAAPMYYARKLKTNRGLLKFILLSAITFGIYGLVVMCGVSTDINTVAQRYDGKKTMHFALLTFLIAPITLGIAVIVWYHKISNRIGSQLQMRGINYKFNAGSFWLWNVLGSLIFVGPFVYMHKMFKSMNLINADFNAKGM